MHVVFLSRTLGNQYGQEKVTLDSARLLQGAGIKVSFVTEFCNDLNIPSLYLVENLYQSLWTSSKKVSLTCEVLLQTLNQIKPSLVHFVEIFHPQIMKKIYNSYPCVLTSHTLSTSCPSSVRHILPEGVCLKKPGMGCFHHTYSYKCLSQFKGVIRKSKTLLDFESKRSVTKNIPTIAISHFVKKTLELSGFCSTQVIYNPIQIPLPISSEISKPVLFTACRLVPHKGVSHVLNALKLIEKEVWEYWIVGEGPLKKELMKQTAELNLSHKVRFLGHLSYFETQQKMQQCKIYIQLNVGPEPFGLSVAEACALGKTVIASNVPAYDEIIENGKTGFLVTPTDSLGVSKIISSSLSSSIKNVEATKRIKDLFSEKNHLQKTLQFYKEVLSKTMSETIQNFQEVY